MVELLARFLFKEKKAFSDLADLVLACSVQDRLFVTISPRSFIRSVSGILFFHANRHTAFKLKGFAFT